MRGELLKDQVALIMGGGGEIGGAIARRFAGEGADVVVADIDQEKAAAVAGDITAVGARSIALACDVSDAADCEKCVETARDAFAKLSILVNVAAAVTPKLDAVQLSLEDWNTALAVNLTASFLTAKYCVPHMRAAGGGVIVNIASQFGQIGVQNRPAYATTKAALIQLTKCLAVDFARDNIRANSLSPGSISTGRSIASYGSREEAQRIRGPAHLAGRQGTAEEVAAGALFLASAESSFMTGADLLLDGGYLAFKGNALEMEKMS